MRFGDFNPKIAPSTIPALVPLKGISEAAHKSQTQTQAAESRHYSFTIMLMNGFLLSKLPSQSVDLLEYF